MFVSPLSSWSISHRCHIIVKAFLKDVINYKKLEKSVSNNEDALNLKDIFCKVVKGLNENLVVLIKGLFEMIKDTLDKLTNTNLFYNNFIDFIKNNFPNELSKLRILEENKDFINTLAKNEELLPESLRCKKIEDKKIRRQVAFKKSSC